MARLLRADNTETIVHPAKKKWTLLELQTLVGGYIEIMPGVPFQMIMDEEGRLKQKPVNMAATTIVREALLATKQELRYRPIIVGDVLILDPKEKI